jgi:hypothetical protein
MIKTIGMVSSSRVIKKLRKEDDIFHSWLRLQNYRQVSRHDTDRIQLDKQGVQQVLPIFTVSAAAPLTLLVIQFHPTGLYGVISLGFRDLA